MPNDPNPSEIHRDAPLNSAYEIVAWVPLVDCYKSKAMYILDYPSTKKSLGFLKKNTKIKHTELKLLYKFRILHRYSIVRL